MNDSYDRCRTCGADLPQGIAAFAGYASDGSLRTVGDAPVKIGKVQYIDFATSFAGTHERIFTKRKSLSHEAEVRLVIQEFHSTSEIGKSIPVDLVALMATIVHLP